MAPCNLKSVILSGESCETNYAGVGDRVYFGLKSDLDKKPTIDDFETGKNCYKSSAFSDLQGKLYAIDIKADSGQVTGEGAEGVEGHSNVGTFVVDKNVDDAVAVLRSARMLDTIWFIPDGKGKYYVLYSATKKAKVADNYDSGTTYDSDHGLTVTITVAPCEFAECKYAPMTTGSSPEPVDLDDWLKTSTSL